ncbi:MAG: hypothetical protein JWP09_622 [Candidatus Taylorbacteria bacterium]|nr:hypothetical protein [Candidatus Taylorbacteria bacterium]
MKKPYYLLLVAVLVLINAVFVYADDNSMFSSTIPSAPQNFSQLVCIVVKLALDFIPYLVVIALGAFIQGLIKYVSHGDDSEKMSEGRKMMIYGILGFFFMVSIWGILGLFTNSFGLQLVIPQFNSSDDKVFSTTCSGAQDAGGVNTPISAAPTQSISTGSISAPAQQQSIQFSANSGNEISR